ncbi:MAG: hypothetical protein L3J56_06955 [Bacteroidales bacterium]|nr:hypothetical protein [Bacteroidales bacterium]
MAKKDINSLLTQNDNTIYPNTSREITEEKLHDHLRDIIESSVNSVDGKLLILKEFIIRNNKNTDFIITEINKLFYDYGKASVNLQTPSGHNWEYYKNVVFKIEENSQVIYNDVLPQPDVTDENPLDAWLKNNLTFNVSADATVYTVKITAYLRINLPDISRIYSYNNSFFQLKGGTSVRYRDMKIRTLNTANFPNFFNSLLDRYVQVTSKTRPETFDNSSIWLSGVQSSFYTANKRKGITLYPFGLNGSENYGRKVWNSSTEVWENIGPNTQSNGFAPDHFILESYLYSFDDDNTFQYYGIEAETNIYKNSLIRVYVIKVIKNGNEDCYYFKIKPLGLDTFELNYFDTSQYELFALLDDGYSTPIIRQIDAEDIILENANRSFRIRKSDLFKTNIMLNNKTSKRSIDKRGYKTCRLFYSDNKGNISGLSPQISVVTNKRGYKTGLMINNI